MCRFTMCTMYERLRVEWGGRGCGESEEKEKEGRSSAKESF